MKLNWISTMSSYKGNRCLHSNINNNYRKIFKIIHAHTNNRYIAK